MFVESLVVRQVAQLIIQLQYLNVFKWESIAADAVAFV